MLGLLLLGVALASPDVTVSLPSGQARAWSGALALHDVRLTEAPAASIRLEDLGKRWELTVLTGDGPVRRIVQEPTTDAQREDVLGLARALLRQGEAPTLSRPTLPTLPAVVPTITVEAPTRAHRSGARSAPAAPVPPPPTVPQAQVVALPAIDAVEQTAPSLSVPAVPAAAWTPHPTSSPGADLFVEGGVSVITSSREGVGPAPGLALSLGGGWGALSVEGALRLTAPTALRSQQEGSTLREREVAAAVQVRPLPMPVRLGVQFVSSHRQYGLDGQAVAHHWQAAVGPQLSLHPRVWRRIHLRASIAAHRDAKRTIMHVDQAATGSLRPWRGVVGVGLMTRGPVRRATNRRQE